MTQQYKFKVLFKNNLSDFNEKSLTYLYQPIIGVQAFGLYKTLILEYSNCKELKFIDFKVDHLLKLCCFQNYDLFLENIKKLEGMNLLETKINYENNSIAYILKSPLDPENFFKNQIFSTLLKKQMGNDEFEIIEFMFRDETDDLKNYENITEPFANIFEIDLQEETKPLFKLRSNNISGKYEKTFNDIAKYLLKHNNLIIKNNNQARSTIISLLSTFPLNYKEYINVLDQWNEQDKLFDSIEFINEITKLNDELYKTINVNKDNKKTKQLKLIEFKKYDSFEYVKKRLGVSEISETIKNIINYLRFNNNLNDDMINCLIDYSCFKNNDQIVGQYLYKIAQTLNEKKIEDVEKCFDHLKESIKYNVLSKNKYYKNKNKEFEIDYNKYEIEYI